MLKFFLLTCLLGLTLAFQKGSSVDDASASDDSDDFLATRGFFNLLSSPINLIKSNVKLNDFVCDGPTCNACPSIKIPGETEKKGCFEIAFDKNSEILSFDLSTGDKQVWETEIKAGSGPSCTQIPDPIKRLCVQDFDANLTPEGDGNFCFTLALTSYKVGAKYCVTSDDCNLKPEKVPSLVML